MFPLLTAVALNAAADGNKRVRSSLMLQESPVAGFSFYEGRAQWPKLQEGDVLELVREPGNPYDPLAVHVDWQGHKLGYVPRAENEDVARLMGEGVRLEARITELQNGRRPRNRVRFEIYIIDESRGVPLH
ncbi:MAG: HIRAN domain-containing protein [Sulfuricellaceae bacterium]|nr:HIRAN domain-containing protein [Sulfuricellaceae bacterium]